MQKKKLAISPKVYLYAAGACLLLSVLAVSYCLFAGFSRHDGVRFVYIDADDTADSVVAQLDTIGHSHTMAAMSTMMRHTGYAQNVRPGRYIVEPGESTFKVFRRLRGGAQTPISLTIPEARTMPRLAALLSRRLMLDSATIARALCDSAFCAQYNCNTATVAAIFVPNTYEVYWTVDMPTLMRRMQSEHDAFWKGSRTAKAEAMGMTPDEVATLASIVDEETAVSSEKPMVAGMYVNRLHTGMPLQADPTIKFALGDFSLRRIYHKHLTVESPYNTYINEGLPPGPIKIASVSGIDAVLNHARHDYLYMCAKEDFSGTHNFARDYTEHLRNAARYAAALNKRGVK